MSTFIQKEIQRILDNNNRDYKPKLKISDSKYMDIEWSQLETLQQVFFSEDKPEITRQVFAAVAFGEFLPIGKKCLLEHFSEEDDGIFETPQSWKSFVNGNFRNGGLSERFLKKWCYDKDEYINRFVQHIGGGKYIAVKPEHIVLEFDYDLLWRRGSDFATSVEVCVTAKLMEG